MKKLYSVLLTSIFCSTILAMETSTTKKPIVITDFDEVWIEKSSVLSALTYLEPLEALFKSKPKQTNAPEKKAKKLNTFTLKFLDYGRRYPRLASYIPSLIEYIGKSRCLNQPIDNLYHHLKKEGYILDIATNKDRMLYDLSIEQLGNEISNMVDKVFVAEPQNDETALAALQTFADQPTTPANYRNMVHRTLTIQPTEKIYHVPSKKPDRAYFEYVVEKIGPDNDMIFIDDNQDNVDAFNALQPNCTHLRRGIQYDPRNPGKFADDITQLGLVSEIRDKKLLDDIRYPGIMGKIKLYTQQTMNRMKAAVS